MLSESLRQLHTFYVVVQQGTLSAAAEALYVTQPALTARLNIQVERVHRPREIMATAG